jgi:monoterpene epsilon-lactone hydrolase
MREMLEKRYAVTIEEQQIGGVPTAVVTPRSPQTNPARVLVELHGGGFMVGGLTAGEDEAIPIADRGRIKVIALNYRQAPEYKFPAASEDVAAVYRELLKLYTPENIGIFGTSAGGLLTAEAISWFQKENLPRPGAAGVFMSGAGMWDDGDSSYWTAPLDGRTPPTPEDDPGHRVVTNSPYFSSADMKDALVAPVWWPAILAKFPPTLLITGTPSFDLSATAFTHRQLPRPFQGVGM